MPPFFSKFKSKLVAGRHNESKLVKLIIKQKWNDVLVLLQAEGRSALAHKGTASVHVTYDGGEYRNGNVLHIMCMYHPPHKVIHRVASMSPLLAIQVNALKQTPLHVAAAYGASHRVISSLIKHGGTSPASMQDAKGRIPLHLHLKHCTPDACNCDSGDDISPTQDGYSSVNGVKRTPIKSKSQPSLLVAGPNVKVLRVLSEAAPQSIFMEDKEGLTPMMIASSQSELESGSYQSKLNSRIIVALQRTADSARKRASLVGDSLLFRPRSILDHQGNGYCKINDGDGIGGGGTGSQAVSEDSKTKGHINGKGNSNDDCVGARFRSKSFRRSSSASAVNSATIQRHNTGSERELCCSFNTVTLEQDLEQSQQPRTRKVEHGQKLPRAA
jgi:hypothetical protein